MSAIAKAHLTAGAALLALALLAPTSASATGDAYWPNTAGSSVRGPSDILDRDYRYGYYDYDPLKGPDGTMDDDNGGYFVPDTRPTR